MVETIIPASLALLVLFWAVGAYKRLVRLRNQSRNAFAQLHAQLKQRNALIPEFVEIAKASMEQEREALESLASACNQALAANAKAAGNAPNAGAMRQMAKAESAVSASLARALAWSESYPDLKANGDMLQLVEELTDAQGKIVFAHQVYNDSVMQYNASLEQFPGSIIATVFAFRPVELLQQEKSPERPEAVQAAV